MKFHKRVPSFSFTTFSFNNNNNNNNNQEQQPTQTHSQPTSPSQAQFEVQEPPSSALPLSSNHHQNQQQNTPLPPPPQQQQQQLTLRPRNGSITLLLSPDDPLQFIVQTSKPCPPRKRSGSLIEQSMSSPPVDDPDRSGTGRRRSSFTESADQQLTTLPQIDRGRISSPSHLSTLNQSSSNPTSNFTRHRKRLSNLFSPLSYYSNHSRSPSPANRNNRRRPSSNHSIDPDSDRESNPDSNSIHPHIEIPSSSEDESDSNQSNSDQSSDLEPELSDPEALTILANTNANASSITPIDYLQKSNQPIPFIDQAPNITSPPPLPISFAPIDPRNLSNNQPLTTLNPKTSISSRAGSVRRRSSIGPRQDLKLTVSRPIYQKNRCTITIEHGDWLEAAKKAERTRFYLVACDLSDESKYAIEWTIGTVLRQGDECLVIMIIETDSKFDPEDGAGTAADRTAKIRNQKDRQEKATLLVREVTALLERTGLHAKVTCQAIHGKNPKHMLVDCIDFLEPNLVIVGRRGVTSSKGNLMGSVSHYLLQKSSVPVMVARRKLRTLPKVYKKKSGVVPTAHQQRKLNEAAIEKSLAASTQHPVPDSKRLSVVSEEIDRLNLQGLLTAPENSQLNELLDQDDKDDGRDDQRSDESDQDKIDKEDHRESEHVEQLKFEEHMTEEQLAQQEEDHDHGKQEGLALHTQFDQGRYADPVVTAHPVSIP